MEKPICTFQHTKGNNSHTKNKNKIKGDERQSKLQAL